MVDHFRALLASQFEASLFMLKQCVEACNDEQWEQKVANGSARWVAYHTLFFTDLYLSPRESAFVLRPQHEKGGDERGDQACVGLSRQDTIEYAAVCRQHAADTLAAETEASLQSPSGFSRLPFSRAELHVYNIRHIQHHVGGLSAFLRRVEGGVSELRGLPWKRAGW